MAPRGYIAAPGLLPTPLDGCASLVDVALYLEPKGGHVCLRLMSNHGAAAPATHLELHPDTLQILREGEVPSPRRMPAASHTLLSGGAPGARASSGSARSAGTWAR